MQTPERSFRTTETAGDSSDGNAFKLNSPSSTSDSSGVPSSLMTTRRTLPSPAASLTITSFRPLVAAILRCRPARGSQRLLNSRFPAACLMKARSRHSLRFAAPAPTAEPNMRLRMSIEHWTDLLLYGVGCISLHSILCKLLVASVFTAMMPHRHALY